GAHAGGEQAVGVGTMLQNGRARAVAEEHAGVAVLPVDDGGESFGADDQHRFVGAGHDELLADFQSVDETGASGFDVESGGVSGAELLLHQAGGGGEEHVRSDGGDDNQLDLVGGDPGLFHRPPGGFGGHVRGEFVVGGQSPFLDVRAGGDPLVGRLDHFFQFGVGQDSFRHVGADGDDGTGATLETVLGSRIFEDLSGAHATAEAGA